MGRQRHPLQVVKKRENKVYVEFTKYLVWVIGVEMVTRSDRSFFFFVSCIFFKFSNIVLHLNLTYLCCISNRNARANKGNGPRKSTPGDVIAPVHQSLKKGNGIPHLKVRIR